MDPEITVTSPARPHTSASQPMEPSPAASQRNGRKCVAPATPAFLVNLGKATLRGIRKCPQCGVYNGTRGLSCKNKACGVTLRDGSTGERGGNRKRVLEVVKVVLDSGGRHNGEEEEEGAGGGGGAEGVQVFSVCQKGRGSAPAQLGFVELVPTDTAIATGLGATLLTRINLGRCFLPSCRQQGQRSNNNNNNNNHNSSNNASRQLMDSSSSSDHNNDVCIHIKQAMECQKLASPLPLKSAALEGLLAPSAVREELWRLATETPGPLVQRVSADRLVVKCQSDQNHPLGLLHLTVGAGAANGGGPAGKRRPAVNVLPHQQEQEVFHCSCQAGVRKGKGSSAQAPLGPGVSETCIHFYACVCALASDDQLALDFSAFINYSPKGESHKVNSSSSGHFSSGKPLAQQQHEPISSQHKRKRLRPDDPFGSSQAVDEVTVALGFPQWLAGVTERLHQTMHYQGDGRPEPLVYLIPMDFFQALQHRLSLGSKKRRLPNSTTAVVRTEFPLGSYCKYTWNITSLLQLQQIFDTPELPLELTQSFVRNADGSYSPFRCPDPPCVAEAVAMGYRLDKPQVIRPLELRTFLKVGTWAEDQKEPTPFLIEWTPDLLPRSRLGELRIGFEFGHQQSGQSEHGGGALSAAGAGRSKLSPDLGGTQTLEILQVVG